MKLYKKIDAYLLHYYPTIWITRLHVFLPIGLILFVVLFSVTAAIPWDPRQAMPDSVVPYVLMIIPVLIYLIYWFVFQSRYNVAKSGGNMPLHHEYLNFFLYFIVFLTAFLLISAIPLGNYQRVKNAVDPEILRQDIEKLNRGNTFFNNSYSVEFHESNSVSYIPSNFCFMNYLYEGEYYDIYPQSEEIFISRTEAENIIKDFIEAYNKYTQSPITKTSGVILSEIEQGNSDPFGTTYSFDYYDYNYYDGTYEVQYKLSEFDDCLHNGKWFNEYQEAWFWKIFLAIFAFGALLIWIFKQMKLWQFVFGIIAIVLTPLFVAIIGVILFELLQIRSQEEEIVSGLVLFFYLLFGIISIVGYRSEKLNNPAYVITMYLHFFLPLLPLFLWLYFGYKRSYYYYYSDNSERTIDLIYYSSWLVGLVSIVLFKPVYSKFRSLPSNT